MKIWGIMMFAIACLAALVASAPSSQPIQDSPKMAKKFKKQYNRGVKIGEEKMKCRPIYRKVDVRKLLINVTHVPDKILSDGNFEPKTLFISYCNDSCSYCSRACNEERECAPDEKEKTFYIRYGRRNSFKYYAHKEKVAKKCECRLVGQQQTHGDKCNQESN